MIKRDHIMKMQPLPLKSEDIDKNCCWEQTSNFVDLYTSSIAKSDTSGKELPTDIKFPTFVNGGQK